ncbi:hypothetical protein BDR26DRAFT_856103 [Obelidium mucronatum]|nr:hypothetical protein BDR26DRAFT_856103 [Obelidium mucronatum]
MRRSSSLGMPRAHTTSFSPSKGAHGDIFSKQTADTIPEDTDELTGEESQREQERSRGRRRSSEVSKGTNFSIRETSFFINPFQKKAGESSRGRPQNSRRSKSGEPSQQEQSKNGSFQDAFRETLLTVVTDKLRSVWKQKRAPWRKLLLDPAVIWQPLGSFERAHDYYGDGSFWIIDAPGHCQGHIMALARTTTSPPTYILFASDAAHAKCLYSPCPVASSADTRAQVGLYGDGYQVAGLPLKELTQSVHDNLSEAYSTIARLSRMDLLDEVFVIAAHETEVESVVELYPESANNWLKKNWKHKTREAMEANNAMDKRDSGRILEDKGGAEVKQLAFELENILSSPIKRTSCSP